MYVLVCVYMFECVNKTCVYVGGGVISDGSV